MRGVAESFLKGGKRCAHDWKWAAAWWPRPHYSSGLRQREPNRPRRRRIRRYYPIIACDTHGQISQVVQAIKDSRFKDKLTELAARPACIYSPLSEVVFGDSEHIGRIEN